MSYTTFDQYLNLDNIQIVILKNLRLVSYTNKVVKSFS